MPFSDVRLCKDLQHTFWFLPNVGACHAMKDMLLSDHFYNAYKVIVCAGNEAGMGVKALASVEKAIGTGFNNSTITLSCGKLTTGVSVKPWTGIFMLRDTSSPETYFQSAFRVQTPLVIYDASRNKKEIIKPTCYIFDFAPNRALRQIVDYGAVLGTNPNESHGKQLLEFLQFLPILHYDGGIMSSIDINQLLDIVASGTSSTMLARKWKSALLVNIDDSTLTRLLGSKEVMDAINRIEGFRKKRRYYCYCQPIKGN